MGRIISSFLILVILVLAVVVSCQDRATRRMRT